MRKRTKESVRKYRARVYMDNPSRLAYNPQIINFLALYQRATGRRFKGRIFVSESVAEKADASDLIHHHLFCREFAFTDPDSDFELFKSAMEWFFGGVGQSPFSWTGIRGEDVLFRNDPFTIELKLDEEVGS